MDAARLSPTHVHATESARRGAGHKPERERVAAMCSSPLRVSGLVPRSTGGHSWVYPHGAGGAGCLCGGHGRRECLAGLSVGRAGYVRRRWRSECSIQPMAQRESVVELLTRFPVAGSMVMVQVTPIANLHPEKANDHPGYTLRTSSKTVCTTSSATGRWLFAASSSRSLRTGRRSTRRCS